METRDFGTSGLRGLVTDLVGSPCYAYAGAFFRSVSAGNGRREVVIGRDLRASSPGLAATSLICLIFSWNEFFYAVNFTSSVAATTPIFLVGFISGRGLFYAKLAAAATVSSLPVLLAGWIAQKQLIRGLTMGAVK